MSAVTITVLLSMSAASMAVGIAPNNKGPNEKENGRQFYSPYGAGTGFGGQQQFNPYQQQQFNPYQQYNPYGQGGQQYNPYQNGYPNQGVLPDPNQGFIRPPIPTPAATTTVATTATTTTTTPRPLQPGVVTAFPLVGAGTGFQRPGNQNILPGYPVYPNFGQQYPYFTGRR